MGVMESFEKFTLSFVRGTSFDVSMGNKSGDMSSRVKQYAYFSNRQYNNMKNKEEQRMMKGQQEKKDKKTGYTKEMGKVDD